MKLTGPHAFISQPLLFIIVAICCSGSVGLGMVSVRTRNTLIANANRDRAKEVIEVLRSINSTKTAIELEQSFDTLRARNNSLRIGLVPLSDSAVKIFDVAEDPIRALAVRASREPGVGEPISDGIRFAFGD